MTTAVMVLLMLITMLVMMLMMMRMKMTIMMVVAGSFSLSPNMMGGILIPIREACYIYVYCALHDDKCCENKSALVHTCCEIILSNRYVGWKPVVG